MLIFIDYLLNRCICFILKNNTGIFGYIYGCNYVQDPFVSPEELVAGKIIALLGRSALRDVWDLASLPEPAVRTMDTPLFRGLFISLAGTLEHPLHSYDKKYLRRGISENSIAHLLTPMLTMGTEIRIEKLVESAWNTVKPLFALTERESEFLSLIEQGQLCPELLFPENKDVERQIASHPALLWKINNVRAHLNRT